MPIPDTTLSRLEMRPTSNLLIATMNGTEAPAELLRRISLVAIDLGVAFGAEPEPIGKVAGSSSLYAYFIGKGRPVLIWPIGPSDKLRAVDAAAGSPAGANPLFFAIHVDWRGDPVNLQGWLPHIVIHPGFRTVHSLYERYPDGSVAELKELFSKEESAAELVTMGNSLAAAGEFVATSAEAVAEKSTSLMIPLLIAGSFLAFSYVYIISPKYVSPPRKRDNAEDNRFEELGARLKASASKFIPKKKTA